MAGIFTAGGNPFAQDPMQLLSTAAMPGDATPPVQPPMPAAAMPDAGTSAPAANAPSATGGGFDLGSIGSRIGDAFSGRGAFGGAADDNEIDPMTGAPKGLARQANGRSMLQLGLTFLLAGQRMSNDQRAAILSKAPGLIGGGDDALNSFAKTRLEMAKLRMEQQKMQQEQAASQALMKGLGLDSSGSTAAPAPSAGAQGVQASQAALAQAAPAVAAPDANVAPVDPSQASPTPVQGAPVIAGGPGREQEAGAAAVAMGAPASIAAPGGVPRAALGGVPPVVGGGQGAGFDPKTLTQAEKLAIVSQPTTAGKSQMFGQIVQARAAGERIGEPQYNSVTGTIQYPKFNGRGEQTGFADGGKPVTTTRDTDKFREEGFTDPRTGQFVVTKRTDLQEGPDEARMAKTDIEAATKDRDTLKENYEKNIRPGLQTYDKIAKLRTDVDAGKGVFGTGADLRRQAYNALATMGYNFDGKLTGDLNVTANFERLMKQGVAGVIKDFNGSQQVSDSDRKFAVDVMQAAATGNREAVKNALDNAAQDIRDRVQRYNEDAGKHNSLLSGFKGDTQKRYLAPTVDRDLSPAQQRQADAQAGNPAPAGVVRYERRDGKIVRVQQ